MCQTLDGIISPCGIVRDSSGNLPPGTKILGSGVQPTKSSHDPGTTTMPSPSTEITAPTGILRDNFGNLPPGTRISVVRTPTGSVVMGTTTVGAINQQIDEDKAKLGPSISPTTGPSQTGPLGRPMLITGQRCPLGPPQNLLESLIREDAFGGGAVLLWSMLGLEGALVAGTGGIGLIALAVPMAFTFVGAVLATDLYLCSEGLTR